VKRLISERSGYNICLNGQHISAILQALLKSLPQTGSSPWAFMQKLAPQGPRREPSVAPWSDTQEPENAQESKYTRVSTPFTCSHTPWGSRSLIHGTPLLKALKLLYLSTQKLHLLTRQSLRLNAPVNAILN